MRDFFQPRISSQANVSTDKHSENPVSFNVVDIDGKLKTFDEANSLTLSLESLTPELRNLVESFLRENGLVAGKKAVKATRFAKPSSQTQLAKKFRTSVGRAFLAPILFLEGEFNRPNPNRKHRSLRSAYDRVAEVYRTTRVELPDAGIRRKSDKPTS